MIGFLNFVIVFRKTITVGNAKLVDSEWAKNKLFTENMRVNLGKITIFALLYVIDLTIYKTYIYRIVEKYDE